MEMNGGFLVTKMKQLGDRIIEKILSEKNIDAFNGDIGNIGDPLSPVLLLENFISGSGIRPLTRGPSGRRAEDTLFYNIYKDKK